MALSGFVQLKLFKHLGVELQQRVGAESKPDPAGLFACLCFGAWGICCC